MMDDYEIVSKGLERTYSFLESTAELMLAGEIQTPIAPENAAEAMHSASIWCKAAIHLLTDYESALRTMIMNHCVKEDSNGNLVFDSNDEADLKPLLTLCLEEGIPVPDDWAE